MTNPNDLASPFAWKEHQANDGKVTSVISHEQSGLSKREYFAAIALQGLCAGCDSHFQPEMFAQYARQYADALIEELNKTTT